MKNYLFEYDHDGERYQMEIPAESQSEAQARFASLKMTGRYIGYVILTGRIPRFGFWHAVIVVVAASLAFTFGFTLDRVLGGAR